MNNLDSFLEAGQKCGPLRGFGGKGKGGGGAITLPPQVLIAIAVLVSMTIIIGGVMYYIGTRESDESKKTNYKFIGVTMIFTAISFTLVILPWYAILALDFMGAIGTLAFSLLSSDPLIRAQSFVAFLLFYALFIVFTGNLGFLSNTLIGIGVGSYFYWYSSKPELNESQKFNSLLLGSLITLPSIALTIIAGKSIQLKGLF